MSVNPIRDQVLVKPIAAETKTIAGLYIPDSSKEGPTKGTVISTGKGRTTKNGNLIPLMVSKGDTVMYAKESGQKVKVNNEDHLIIVEDQILAIID
jgi:chaperonin GroES